MSDFPRRPFVFVRHGETAWNSRRVVMGWIDEPLNDRGRAQARAAAAALAGVPLAAAWSSTLSRARETARIILDGRHVPLGLEPGLRERAWGEWEGRGEDERPARTITPKGGEGLDAFAARTIEAVQRVLSSKPKAGTVLVVAHSGTYRVLCRHLGLDDGEGPQLTNGAAILFEPPTGGGEWRRTDLTARERP